MKRQLKQQGFTLIELIMVIVILGVLSAFALPRFADLGGNARTASINGLAASLRAAANIAHAQQLAEGLANNANVTLEGQVITMVAGYPAATAAGISEAAQVSDNDYTIVYDATDDEATFSLDATGTCEVTYTETTGAPNVVIDTSGC